MMKFESILRISFGISIELVVMELYKPEAEILRKMITEWTEHDERELEATFGTQGQVNPTRFLAIAQRLRAKGFTALPQEDRLTITLENHIRFTLVGLGVIQQYCTDNIIANKPFVAMIKDRRAAESNLDLEEYDTRIKVRREIPLSSDDAQLQDAMSEWGSKKKAFRMIRRWTFEGKGVRFDLSIVHSTLRDRRGNYRWVYGFLDQDILAQPATYEVEVELIRDETLTGTPEKALSAFVNGLGEVLRGLQKNTVLIRNSVAKKILDAYRKLTGNDRFRGVAPVTLERVNFEKEKEQGYPNLRDGYNVTDKADGLRVHGFTDSDGNLYMIDMSMTVYRTGLQKKEMANTLVDGEWVTVDKNNSAIQQLLLFDIYYNGGKDTSQLPFFKTDGTIHTRYKELNSWIETWNGGDGPTIRIRELTPQTRLHVGLKRFRFGRPGDDSIFHQTNLVLNDARIYNIDGVIFTPNDTPLPTKSGVKFGAQFKWKPAKDSTVDFLVYIQKEDETKQDEITVGIKPSTGEEVRYKTLRLYVGSSQNPALLNPRATVLLDKIESVNLRQAQEYKPVLFTPGEFPDPMANVCYCEIHTDPDSGSEYVETEHNQEPISDKSIVEMRYDPSQPRGWRWIPVRVRHDKTERFQRGQLGRTLNKDEVAESVWKSIHDPITESMIRTGSEEPSQAEMESISRMMLENEAVASRYYERKAPTADLNKVRGLRDFHNRWIKEQILLRSTLRPGGKSLIDVSVGRAADLQKWRRSNVGFVLGVDIAGENITSPKGGAYSRYLDTILQTRNASVSPMIFVIGNSSKMYINGDAGATGEESDILRSLFGRMEPEGAVPPFVRKEGVNKLAKGADVIACMFGLHYFFETSNMLDGLLNNIRECLKVGGYFICCCFDGDSVFQLLRDVENGKSKSGVEGESVLWTITKRYEQEEIPQDDDAFGMAIDVEFISIGMPHREYLVPFQLFVQKMKTIGCEILNETEAKQLGLQKGTNMFRESWDMAFAAKHNYAMTPAVKEFSFLNRWYIFQKKGEPEAVAVLPDAPVPDAPVPVSVSVVPDAVPVSVVPSAATVAQKYAASDIFQFYEKSALNEKDALKIKDPGAARWLSLYAPFPIEDPDDSSIKYPSVAHFLAAMKLKKASNKPQLATDIFSNNGILHQEFISQRLLETNEGRRLISPEKDHELLLEEYQQIDKRLKQTQAKFDESSWASQKDDMLEYALQQRWERDPRLRKIVEAVRNQGKILLYYSTSIGLKNLGGMRRADGRIDGSNKVGQILMKLARFPGYQ
jgi:SAM-dependent methyltransferase